MSYKLASHAIIRAMERSRVGQLESSVILRSAATMAVDIIAPGSIPLSQPIEGFPTRVRYNARLCRVRAGHLVHGYWGVDAMIHHDYKMAAVQLAALTAGIISVGYGDWRRNLRRLYVPTMRKKRT